MLSKFSAFALLSFQEIDKFNLFRDIVDLKGHMMKIHKWSEPKASAARGNLYYNKKRKLLSPSKWQTKQRIYKRQQCPMKGWFKLYFTQTTKSSSLANA